MQKCNVETVFYIFYEAFSGKRTLIHKRIHTLWNIYISPNVVHFLTFATHFFCYFGHCEVQGQMCPYFNIFRKSYLMHIVFECHLHFYFLLVFFISTVSYLIITTI